MAVVTPWRCMVSPGVFDTLIRYWRAAATAELSAIVLPGSFLYISGMRTLIAIAATAALVASAQAGVLPITGEYCDASDLVLNANGIGGEEDGCTFKAVLESGPSWWVISQQCTNTDDTPKIRVELSGKDVRAAYYRISTGRFDELETLHACP